jgi:opacity protein-like surface antigen
MTRSLGYLMLALAAIIAACVSVPLGHAEDLPKASKVYSPLDQPVPETLGWKAHNAYIGIMGSYAWRPDPTGEGGDKPDLLGVGGPLADEWQLGLVAGYLYRSGATGWAGGVEIDWTPHELSRLRDDDGTLTVRGRAGAFVSSKVFVYGTAGFMLDQDVLTGLVMQGPVVGGGVEFDITKNLAVGAELLHYRYGSDYLDWGDEGATQVRVRALVKF